MARGDWVGAPAAAPVTLQGEKHFCFSAFSSCPFVWLHHFLSRFLSAVVTSWLALQHLRSRRAGLAPFRAAWAGRTQGSCDDPGCPAPNATFAPDTSHSSFQLSPNPRPGVPVSEWACALHNLGEGEGRAGVALFMQVLQKKKRKQLQTVWIRIL